MSTTITLRASGLNTSPNQLSVPEGSLSEAENVIIRRDNIIEPRRGMALYGTALGGATDRAKQLIGYKGRILRHFLSTLQFDDGTGTFTSFAGTYAEAEAGLRTKSVEANGNLYFTTAQGIQKLAARNPTDFTTSSGYIVGAGGIKAADLSTTLNTSPSVSSAWFTNDSTVAYRVLWGIKDVNENLILGTPSERNIIYNSYNQALVRDYLKTLTALDSASYYPGFIYWGQYVSTYKLPITALAGDVLTNLVAVTKQIDSNISYLTAAFAGSMMGLATNSTADVTVTSGTCTINTIGGPPNTCFYVGDKVELTNFTMTTGSIVGIQTITAIGANSFSFATAATGPCTSVTGAKVISANYRNITIPSTPAIPNIHTDIASVQNYLNNIILRLQVEPSSVVGTVGQTQFLSPLKVATGYTTKLNFSIPSGVTANHFFQIYRSNILTAGGVDQLSLLTPSDELKLAYEGNPSAAQLAAQQITVEDITPDSFLGANLYTNPSSGEGIAQANDVPPYAKDINRFKNYVFFANTKTKHRSFLSLLGVQSMLSVYNAATPPKLTISAAGVTNTYSFIKGVKQITTLTCGAGSTITPSGYFNLNSANDFTKYYVWYDTTGTDTDPAPAGRTGIKVRVLTGDSSSDIAKKTAAILGTYPDDFVALNSTSTVTITNGKQGPSTTPTIVTGLGAGWAVSVATPGAGEDPLNQKVLLSTNISPAQAVDETARSLVRVINRTSSSGMLAFYVSSVADVPGKFYLEAKTLADVPYYIVGNTGVIGAAFSPDLSPPLTISSNSIAAATVVTTTTVHGFNTGDQVVISGSNSTPTIDGIQTVTVLSTTTFSIPVTVTVAGSAGGAIGLTAAKVTSNEVKPNRIYYSKIQQPEAVPLLNYFDVGAKDRAILRIFPLRDSLFVMKQDGIFRVSGETAPFSTQLFDSSAILKAPDSVAVANNTIFGWFTQGVSSVNETGVSIASRAIDNQVLEKASSIYPNFTTATFGVGYDSDNSYLAFTTKATTDTVATMAYRYNTLTNSWTTFTYGATCGIINTVPGDDKMYIGVTDTNSIAQERKKFTREDYADRQSNYVLGGTSYVGNVMQVSGVQGVAVGDVVIQVQQLTSYFYNALLKKLDTDAFTAQNYYSTIGSVNGDVLYSKVDQVITKIANDPVRLAVAGATSAATYLALVPTGFTYDQIVVNYNLFIDLMNNDLGISWNDYAHTSGTTQFETDIIAVNPYTNIITIRNMVNFCAGPLTIYKGIPTKVTYCPNLLGDAASMKQVREATIMFANKAFTAANLSFGSDLLPSFEGIDFHGDGNGIFGQSNTFGQAFFGGASNSIPFRTYVPRNKQRCRYLVCRFQHVIARETFAIYGLSLTGNVGITTRAYR